MFDRCLYFNVNALARVVNKIWSEAFAEFELSPAHAYMLRLVLAQPGIAQKDLAAELRLEKSTVTRFVDGLQDKGLVQRKKGAAADSRAQHVHPTAKARKLREALEATGDGLYQTMVAAIGKDRLARLVGELRETAKKLD